MATSKIKNNRLITQTFTKSVTVASGGNSQEEISITTPSGYTPVGVVGFSTRTRYLVVHEASCDTSKATLWVENTSSAERTITVQVTVLFQPN